jgi:uncharacterized protein (TIGR00251 family)
MQADKLAIKKRGEGVTFSVKVVPNSSRNAIAGLLGSVLKVNISVVAQKGKANQGLINLLGEVLGRPKSAFSIISGSSSPFKEIFVAKMTRAELESKLSEYLA